jgi:hypothetical protein
MGHGAFVGNEQRADLDLWFPTLATKTKTSQGWGTRFIGTDEKSKSKSKSKSRSKSKSKDKSNRRSFDYVRCGGLRSG